MATDLRSDPELARVITQARVSASEAGEILAASTSIESPLGPEAREIVAAWLDEGGYEQAVAVIETEDPDLRTE